MSDSLCYKGLRIYMTEKEDIYARVLGRYSSINCHAKTKEEAIKIMKTKIDEYWEKKYPKC